MDVKEKRVRALTKIYYSNPAVRDAIVKFAVGREVVPRYFEGFGKRPDMIQYPSDVNGWVKKGATSFHCSEEIWEDPLQLSSDSTYKDLNELRKNWDLLIDVDSKYLDVSKILTGLLIETLENYGIMNYGVKFSGSKGFHIFVSGDAFPETFEGESRKLSFPAWPRAICEYLTHVTRKEFNRRVNEIFGSLKNVEKNEKAKESLCPSCGRPAKKGSLVTLKCPDCGTEIQRKDMKVTKKRLKCVRGDCAGVFEVVDQKDYFQCEYCEDVSSINKKESSGRYATTFTAHAKSSGDYSDEMKEEFSGTFFGASDLVLVAPRHLFRMPYSLHEKTSLASVVLEKGEIENFSPKDADPMKVKVKEFFKESSGGEGSRLLEEAVKWKKENQAVEEKFQEKKYQGKKFEKIDIQGVTEEMFPPAIKKLLKGLDEGRKRGLFVLLTFLRSINFSPEEINKKVREWNEKNEPPLKEGYVRSQIDWHLKQRKQILPPNYSNEAFYRDIGLIKDLPKTKNPLVDVKRIIWKKNRS